MVNVWGCLLIMWRIDWQVPQYLSQKVWIVPHVVTHNFNHTVSHSVTLAWTNHRHMKQTQSRDCAWPSEHIWNDLRGQILLSMTAYDVRLAGVESIPRGVGVRVSGKGSGTVDRSVINSTLPTRSSQGYTNCPWPWYILQRHMTIS